MIRYYFKDTFRYIWKYKKQTFTGILGLVFSLACFVPVLSWLRYETTYDNFYPDAKYIYRIYSKDKQTGNTNDLVSGILDKKLHEQFESIQASTVFFVEQNDCSTAEKPHIQLRTLFTDSTFFSVFPQVIISDNTWNPLQIRNNIVITKTVALRLFGDVEKAIGQQIKSTSLINNPPYTVTAVVKDPPPNTNLPFDAILSNEQIEIQKSFVEKSGNEIWNLATLQMFVRLRPHTDINYFTTQLCNFPLQSYGNSNIELRMLPISSIRHKLTQDVPFTLNFIRLLLIAGTLLLFSALFNFLHLYLDLYHRRVQEFRIRSINGASVSQLISQMVFEFTFTILLTLLFSCCFVVIIHTVFFKLMGIVIEPSEFINLLIVCELGVLLLMLIISFIFFRRMIGLTMHSLSKRNSTWQSGVQRIAVTLQLAVSVVFIASTLIGMMQMHFINSMDLGFERNNVIYLPGLNPFIENNARVALLDELRSMPQIENITDASFTPQHKVNPFNLTTNVEWPGKLQSEKPAFNFISTDSQFAEIFRIKMLKGEWLNEDRHKIVLNEEAVRVMGLQKPIGTIIRMTLRNTEEFEVVGVVKDFYTLSLRNRISPTIFITTKYPINNYYIRVIPGQEQEAIQRINVALPKIDASFTDIHPVSLIELYDCLNHSEQIGLKIFLVLAVVCLLTSLFGIYAIATVTTQFRRKEIAMRKVVGAKTNNIVFIFFYGYTKQVLKANLLVFPLIYFAMSAWLQGYAYRTSIPWWLFVGVATGVLIVVLFTVLGQVLKVANNNPVNSLRDP